MKPVLLRLSTDDFKPHYEYVSGQEKAGKRKTYKDRQKLPIKGFLGLTHCFQGGPNSRNIVMYSSQVGGGGSLKLKIGCSQSILPLERGLFACDLDCELFNMGHNLNDLAPKGFVMRDQIRSSQLPL
jgi:hypothetical protein